VTRGNDRLHRELTIAAVSAAKLSRALMFAARELTLSKRFGSVSTTKGNAPVEECEQLNMLGPEAPTNSGTDRPVWEDDDSGVF